MISQNYAKCHKAIGNLCEHNQDEGSRKYEDSLKLI
jgi:hypothetical protein